MRLTEILERVARRGAEHFLQKHAGISPLAGGIALGISLPDMIAYASKHHEDVVRRLDRASSEGLVPHRATKHAASYGDTDAAVPHSLGQLFMNAATGYNMNPNNASAGAYGAHAMGSLINNTIAPVAGAPGRALAGRLDRWLGPPKEFGEARDAPHYLAQSALGAFGKEMGTMGAGLLKDMASKAMAAVGSMGDQAARDAILKQLKREDPTLADADDKVLMEAFHTMSRFAPVLSTDKNAVRSFLRQAVMSGAGADYMSIKLLADAERAVTGDKKE